MRDKLKFQGQTTYIVELLLRRRKPGERALRRPTMHVPNNVRTPCLGGYVTQVWQSRKLVNAVKGVG